METRWSWTLRSRRCTSECLRRQHACATDCLQSDIERVQVYRARIHQAKHWLVRRWIHQWEWEWRNNFYWLLGLVSFSEYDDQTSQFSMDRDSAEEGMIDHKNRESVSRSSSRTVGLVSILSVSGTFSSRIRRPSFPTDYTWELVWDFPSFQSLEDPGSIQVGSEVGKGTIFTLTVPLQVPLNQSKTIEDSQLIWATPFL
jgi:hypothetical protein